EQARNCRGIGLLLSALPVDSGSLEDTLVLRRNLPWTWAQANQKVTILLGTATVLGPLVLCSVAGMKAGPCSDEILVP
ncbi:MAG: hypothetical protein J7M40_14570, partial [Planctomycetes bacterium]|nr:hypothetical protein [Planctomycetota bacterium]